MVSMLGLGVRVQGVENPLSTPPMMVLPRIFPVHTEFFIVLSPGTLFFSNGRSPPLASGGWCTSIMVEGDLVDDFLLGLMGFVPVCCSSTWLERELVLILRLEGWDSEGEACWELEGEGWECRPMTGVLGMEGGPQAGTAGTLSSSLD